MSLNQPLFVLVLLFFCHPTILYRSRDEFAGGFVVDFVLAQNTLSLVFVASSSAVTTYLVLLASVAGSMIGVFAVLVKRLESMFAIRDESAAEDATAGKHVPQIDDGAEARFGSRVRSRQSLSLTANVSIVIFLHH